MNSLDSRVELLDTLNEAQATVPPWPCLFNGFSRVPGAQDTENHTVNAIQDGSVSPIPDHPDIER